MFGLTPLFLSETQIHVVSMKRVNSSPLALGLNVKQFNTRSKFIANKAQGGLFHDPMTTQALQQSMILVLLASWKHPSRQDFVSVLISWRSLGL